MRMSQAFCTAGRTVSDCTSSSTTYEPASLRTTRTSSPARIDANAIMRRIESRRPRAIQSAIAARRTGRIQSQEPRNLSSLRQVLRGLEPVGFHDLDPARVGPEALGDGAENGHPLAELDHQRLEVEDDLAALGAERRHVVLQHVDQLPVRPGHALHPERLDARALEHAHGGPVRELAQARGGRAGQAFLLGGQLLLERRRDVDVREQLLDEAGRDLVADLVVGDHLGGGVRDRVRVEPLEADVAREQAQHREQGRQDDEHACNRDAHGVFIADASACGNHTIGMKWRSRRSLAGSLLRGRQEDWSS